MAAECVKVIVRCRPMNEREKSLDCKTILKIEENRALCAISHPGDEKSPPKSFTFDGAYFVNSTTEQIYNDIAYPLVEGVTEGYNGTIFAYGQTGCGKSYTMQGVANPASQRGIIPRAFDHIFETVSVEDHRKFLIHASYLEIYNEAIRDLLGKDAKAKLELKEHPEKGVYVNDLSMHPVHNVQECERIMQKGWANRATGATLMNADSSRSHSIFTISLEMITEDEEGEEHIRAGKLNLVDLAGSERQGKTGATGDRLKEATKINLSLSALGNVISSLVDGRSKHIPYRDSKLTRLLQDSLGGNTKTMMVACLSPADNNYEETLSTLRYANRAKNIKNKPKINEDPKDALLRQYQEEIEKLKAMLMGQIPLPAGGFSDNSLAQAQQQRQTSESPAGVTREELMKDKERLREEYESQMSEMAAMFEKEKVDKAKLQQDMKKLRQFYDEKLKSVDGQIAHLPPTAADSGEHLVKEGESYESVTGGVVAARVAASASDDAIFARETGEIERPGTAAPRDRPQSVLSGQALPSGPELHGYEEKVLNGEQQEGGAPHVANRGVDVESGQKISSGKKRIAAVNKEGVSVPTVSKAAVPEQLKLQHDEALRRLQELQQQMVGGENLNNFEVKERRKKRKRFAEERRTKLAAAIRKMDDDGIMLNIYDNIQDELKDKNRLLAKEREQIESLEKDIIDLRSEFEFDRIDYLDTIRKQEKQIKLLELLIDRIHPCLRKDCNYSNLDKIKAESKWDDGEQKWILPKMMIERTALPSSGPGTVMPGDQSYGSRSRTGGVMTNGEIGPSAFDSAEDDRLRERLRRSDDSGYFQPKRASQLLNSPEPINTINMREIRDNFAVNGSVSDHYDDPASSALRAAQVHGQLHNDEGAMRRPQRLEALPSVTGKKSKKKRSSVDAL